MQHWLNPSTYMRALVATPVRVVDRHARRLILEAEADWARLGCGTGFLMLALLFTCFALVHGVMAMPAQRASMVWLLDGVLVYQALRCLLLPLAHMQELILDKDRDRLIVRKLVGLSPTEDEYRLSDVIKVHHNLVDDGTFDGHSVVLIFRGGGAIQFPLGGGQPATVASLVTLLTRFIGVRRSDATPGKSFRVRWVPKRRRQAAELPPVAEPAEV